VHLRTSVAGAESDLDVKDVVEDSTLDQNSISGTHHLGRMIDLLPGGIFRTGIIIAGLAVILVRVVYLGRQRTRSYKRYVPGAIGGGDLSTLAKRRNCSRWM
jgi:hypothetical protein